MKIKDLYELNIGIKAIAEKELPIKVAFLVQKNIGELEVELKAAETVRIKLVEKYKDVEASKGAEQGTVILQKDKLEEYNKELTELMDQEVDIELKQIKIDDLEGIKMKPVEMMQLKYMISE